MGEIYLKEDLFTGTGGIVWGSDYAFPISYHKSMLEDTQRIQLYKKAIESTVQDKVVIDVGAGTGILSLYAVQAGAKKIYALEKDFETYNFIHGLVQKSTIVGKTIEFINTSSFDFSIEPFDIPQVLISELIGAVGPEEGIVEAFFDIKTKNPSLASFIPHTIDICCDIFYSNFVENEFQNNYTIYSRNLPYFKNEETLFGDMYAQKFLFHNFMEETAVSDQQILKTYSLGIDQISDFKVEIKVPEHANTIAVFFKAYLDVNNTVTLTNCPGSSLHWLTPYLRKPYKKERVTIEYRSKNNFFFVHWD